MRTCLQCGKSYLPGRGASKFCSTECGTSYTMARRAVVAPPGLRPTRSVAPLESKFRASFEQSLRAAGHIVVRIDPSTSNGLVDWPDAMVLGRGGTSCFIEFKRRGKKARPGQQLVLDKLASLGHTVFLVDRLEQFAAVVESLKGKETGQ